MEPAVTFTTSVLLTRCRLPSVVSWGWKSAREVMRLAWASCTLSRAMRTPALFWMALATAWSRVRGWGRAHRRP